MENKECSRMSDSDVPRVGSEVISYVCMCDGVSERASAADADHCDA